MGAYSGDVVAVAGCSGGGGRVVAGMLWRPFCGRVHCSGCIVVGALCTLTQTNMIAHIQFTQKEQKQNTKISVGTTITVMFGHLTKEERELFPPGLPAFRVRENFLPPVVRSCIGNVCTNSFPIVYYECIELQKIIFVTHFIAS